MTHPGDIDIPISKEDAGQVDVKFQMMRLFEVDMAVAIAQFTKIFHRGHISVPQVAEVRRTDKRDDAIEASRSTVARMRRDGATWNFSFRLHCNLHFQIFTFNLHCKPSFANFPFNLPFPPLQSSLSIVSFQSTLSTSPANLSNLPLPISLSSFSF